MDCSGPFCFLFVGVDALVLWDGVSPNFRTIDRRCGTYHYWNSHRRYMNRDILAAEAEGYRKGRTLAFDEMKSLCDARIQAAYDRGRRDEKRRQRRYAWGKLFVLTVVGSAIGAGIAIAAIYYLTAL
jgi:hypothetical protein